MSWSREDGGDFAHLWAWEPLSPPAFGDVLVGFQKAWWICGGWALDLLHGRETRRHDDLDVAILRRDQLHLHEFLGGWDIRYATAEHTLEPWDGHWLAPPIHGVWARRPHHPASAWTCEFLLNEAHEDQWVFRHDDRVRRDLNEIGAHGSGVPYLRPEVVLLYKAGEPSPKNDADFALAHGQLSHAEASWLADAIRTCYPDHPWIAELARLERPG
jgi:hypothetical protein